VEVSPPTAAPLVGETVQLTATPKTAGGSEVSGKTVQWTSSAPAVVTVSSAGLVSAVAAGAGTVTATVDGKTGSATISVRASDSLPGLPTASAATAIPRQAFVSRPPDYATDHPDLPGVPLSFNTLTVAFAADATVGAVNAILTEFNAKIVGGLPGTPGQAPGILFLRLPTRSHAEMLPRLALLRQRSGVVAAAQDVILTPADVPAPNGSNPAAWQWTLAPSGGAWGPIAIRAPEMWNLNDAIRKTGVTTTVGVLDVGFASHPDLLYSANLSPTAVSHLHGTHVAGTIGATFGNGVGVDGINPFARLVVDAPVTAGDMVAHFEELLAARPDLQVVSISLAYNWRSNYNIDTRVGVSGAAARAQADIDGLLADFALSQIQSAGKPLPVVVVAAGNDSRAGDQDAVYATPFANAALAHHAAPIIVVEAVGLNAPGSYSRAAFSNLGGHVSAPGVGILSTDSTNGYSTLSGTSMATPHVSGVVSYLYSLDPALPAPTMTTNVVRDLLVATARPITGAAPMIDGFAAALSLDSIRGDHRTLGLLLDVDDGTIDGNTRVNAAGAAVTSDTKGDGKVDMADFRRWRDWLLESEQPTSLALDGAPGNLKKDLNGDGVVSPAIVSENVHSRGDFNGDGEISRTKTAKVPGVKNGQPATDLEVFRARFSDPDYQSSALPGLLDSWDLDADPAQCLALPGVVSVRTSVFPNGGTTPIAVRTHLPSDRRHVITLPVPSVSQDVLVEAIDATGNTIASHREAFAEDLGADVPLDPVCTGFFIQATFPTVVVPGAGTQLTIKVGDRDLTTGATTFTPAVTIDIVVAGGTLTQASGQTDANGQFLTTATLAPGNTLLTIFITATKHDGTFLTKIVNAAALPPSQTLDFTFAHDAEGWTLGGLGGSCCAGNWGKSRWLLDVGAMDGKGVIEMDGSGDPGNPNAWITKSFVLPANVTTLQFDVWGHNRDDSDARLIVRIFDGAFHTLDDEIIVGGPDNVLQIFTKQLNIAAWAGRSVTIWFEQDDNGFVGHLPGSNEQIVLDNIHIRP
jgi:hypothetical protein